MDSMNIQWYPGHMTKTRRQMEQDLKLVDAVCELLDARIPISSRNPDIAALCGPKPRLDIQTVLNHAVNLLDMRTPCSPAFYASVEKARAYLAENLYEKMGGHSDVIATCIGHTHIDVAWWWTPRRFLWMTRTPCPSSPPPRFWAMRTTPFWAPPGPWPFRNSTPGSPGACSWTPCPPGLTPSCGCPASL